MNKLERFIRRRKWSYVEVEQNLNITRTQYNAIFNKKLSPYLKGVYNRIVVTDYDNRHEIGTLTKDERCDLRRCKKKTGLLIYPGMKCTGHDGRQRTINAVTDQFIFVSGMDLKIEDFKTEFAYPDILDFVREMWGVGGVVYADLVTAEGKILRGVEIK